ncbi:MAG TPA: bifunctional precorrin-2 dehydrogenase/sirohydrochlorin ferrochelatase [Syntrophomonas sp.]|jgi:precorrin-2 dehydrogenase/sirohydrochlorin ferrochelatase|nr:bifunctional precorrin-2 dehydrogenase/sirohydrochlorin ferrochelatase [Syntrophomonas sp.]
MEHLYPVYLSLVGKTCLIIGGGPVAERKVANLLEYGAQVKVVSPRVEKRIAEWANEALLNWTAREFAVNDLDGIFVVFIATDDSRLNQEIAWLCRQRGILVNVVDDPPNCDFFVPSVLRRNSLAVAISTEGKSPLFAARLRRELEAIITNEHGEFVDLLGQIREEVKNSPLAIKQRQQILEQIVNSDILALLQAGLDEEVEERIKECMSSLRG